MFIKTYNSFSIEWYRFVYHFVCAFSSLFFYLNCNLKVEAVNHFSKITNNRIVFEINMNELVEHFILSKNNSFELRLSTFRKKYR